MRAYTTAQLNAARFLMKELGCTADDCRQAFAAGAFELYQLDELAEFTRYNWPSTSRWPAMTTGDWPQSNA